jgi:hypothetical protein
MARLARNIGQLALPADALLTPGTFDQEIALTQRSELLLVCSILRLEIEKPFLQLPQLVSRPQHIDT